MNVTMKALVSVASAALGAWHLPAHGADLGSAYKQPAPFVPQDLWTGFYVGAQLGYGSMDGSSTYAGTDSASAKDLSEVNSKYGVPLSYGPSASGFVAGGRVGYDWHFVGSPLLLGIMGRWDYFGRSGTVMASGTAGTGNKPTWSTTSSLGLTSLGMAGPKVGAALDNWLLYADGGVAWGQVNQSVSGNLSLPAEGFNSNSNSFQWGWAAGGGVCYAFNAHWNACGDYLYADLGSYQENFATLTGVNVEGSHSVKAQEETFSINYKF